MKLKEVWDAAENEASWLSHYGHVTTRLSESAGFTDCTKRGYSTKLQSATRSGTVW